MVAPDDSVEVNGLTEETTVADGDLIHINDVSNSNASRKMTKKNFVTGIVNADIAAGAAIESSKLDADTAHLTTDQTFSGDKTFSGELITTGRLKMDQGADVASGSELTLGADGNSFDITGTTTINTILGTDWALGNIVYLRFDGILTVTHNSGGTNDILLGDAANMTTAAGDILTLQFDGTDWREVSRSVVGGGSGEFPYTKVLSTVDTTVYNTTTKVSITGLNFSIEANKNYEGYTNLSVDGFATSDIRVSCTEPTGCETHAGNVGMQGTPFDWPSSNLDGGSFIDGSNGHYFSFQIRNGANAGTIQITFAQLTAQTHNTTVLKDTVLFYRELTA